jgi:hypothetical protein
VRGGFGGHKNHPEKGRVALPGVIQLSFSWFLPSKTKTHFCDAFCHTCDTVHTEGLCTHTKSQ